MSTVDHQCCGGTVLIDELGILISISDALALADAIQELIKNPAKQNVMGKKSRS